MMDIGIGQENRKLISDSLIRVLADHFILSLKARHYHWNVTGPDFLMLHQLFQMVYEDLDGAGDDIAERIRALGFLAPGSYVEFISLSVIKEEIGAPEHNDMLQRLVLDMEIMVRRMNETKDLAASVKDDGSADLIIGRLRALEKLAWMLRSHLE